MTSVEKSAKTKEEAIEAALAELNASISDVTITVLDEGSKGLFGLFGAKQARVRVTLKVEEEDDDLLSLLADKPKPAPKPVQRTAPEKKPEAPKPEKKPEAPKAEKKPEAPKPEKKAEEAVQADDVKSAEPKSARQPRQRKPQEPKEARKPREPKEPKPQSEKKPLPPKPPVKPLEKPVVTMIPDDQVAADSAAGKAQAFLKELTHLMGVEVTVAVGNDEEGNVFVQMSGDTLGILIGRRGETLDALQYLTSLRINRGQEDYTRVTLDTENYRAKREDTLVRLANRMANRAVKTGRKVSLEPMNPYERRIIHSALQANEAVDTHSEGDEPNRHVVITLRKA